RVVAKLELAHPAPEGHRPVGPHLVVERSAEVLLDPHPPLRGRLSPTSAEVLEGELEPGIVDLPLGHAARGLRRPAGVLACAAMVGEEVRRLVMWGERHRRLLARILIAFGLSVVVDLICGTLMWSFESGVKGSDIHDFGDALFFSTVQILTVSS